MLWEMGIILTKKNCSLIFFDIDLDEAEREKDILLQIVQTK